MRRLNLSFNDLEGMVPEGGIFKNASATSVAGNSKLCGGMAEFHMPQCNFKETKSKTGSLSMKLIIAAASGSLCAALALFSLFLFLAKRKRVEPTSSSRSSEDGKF